MKKLLTLIICATGIVLLEANPAQPATLEVRPPGGMGTLGDVYTSIQQAIDEAEPGDIIEVATGVYDGNTVGPDNHLVVDKANLTLKSKDGKDSTTINVANGVGIDIRAGAVNFVLGGAAGHGFTIAGKADTTFVIQLTNAPSGVEISHNAIDTTGNASMGISVGAAGAADLTISNNDFVADSGDGCIWGPRLVDLTVSDNTFDGGAYAIQTSGVTSSSPSLISGNVITDFTGSGGIVICNGEETSGLTISDNTITGCTSGIRFAEYCAQGTPGDMTTVTVEDNTLSGNDKGIRIGNGPHVLASNFTIQNNCFNGNTTYGLQNEHATELVTAEKNAWSDPNGPYHPDTNPYTSGDEVSDNVDYYPWYPDCTFTSLVYKPVHNVTINAYYYTIQAAIDEASPDDVIEADAGTFTEDVTIDKSLTLNGAQVGVDARGRSESESEIVGVVEVTSAATDVVFDGFKFTSPTRAFTPRGFNLHIESENSTIKNCIFDAEENAGHTYSGYLDFGGIRNTTVERNSFSGHLDPTQTPNVIMLGITGAGTVTVTHNEMHNVGGGGGIGVMCSNDDAVINIIDNEIENTGDGIWFWDPTGGSFEVNIQSNTIYNCQKKGVKIVSPVGITAVNCNRIYDNTEEGVYNSVSSLLVDATSNWWGDASGPSGEGGGSGDAVSTNVDFFPWLLTDNIEACAELTQVAADFVVDDDWVDKGLWETVTVDSTDYYIGLNAFADIQDAVTAASDGNSIKVADGNYTGAIVNEDLTIIGANPGGSVITDGPHYGGGHPTAKTAFKVDADADGLEIKNFTIDCNAANNFYFAIFSRAANDVLVDSLTINNPVQGITNYGGSNWQIINNVLNYTEAAGGGGIAIYLGAYPPDYVVLHDNIVKGNAIVTSATAPTFTCPGISMALDLRYRRFEQLTGNEDIAYNMIVDNDIEGTGVASEVGIEIGVIGLEGDPNKIAATLGLIHDNTVRNNVIDNTDWGIYFYTVADLRVLGNELIDCNEGIHMKDGHTGIAINYNAIYGSASYGLNNNTDEVVDAELNWWGDISGPNDPCGTNETDGVTCYDVSTMKNTDGSGDTVTQNADYCPWLTAPVSPSDNPYMAGDLNFDGCVDFRDFAIFALHWLEGCE